MKQKVYLQYNLKGPKWDTTILLKIIFANYLQMQYLQDQTKK